MKLASNASRPGFAVGMLRVLCNGMRTAQRFRNDEQAHTCHTGCPDRPDSLSLIITNALDCMNYFPQCGDKQTYNHEGVTSYSILSPSFPSTSPIWYHCDGLIDAFVLNTLGTLGIT